MREEIPKNLRILSLDGGEARCLSQLEILREFMHRLNMDTGVDRRPCDYFHWIGGAGAGGVVAMLLVTFAMSADEASTAFAQICTSVLPEEQCSPTERASRLETITKGLLEGRNLKPDTMLMDETNSSTCKLGLFYMSAVNMGRCLLLRNYESRQLSYNPTIIEAIRVVWATPGLFSSVHIGHGIVQEEVISAVNGFNNPTLEVIKEIHQVFGQGATISSLLSLGAGRAPIRYITSGTNAVSKALEQLATDGDKTAEEVQRRIGRLEVYFRFSVDRGLDFDNSSAHMGSIVANTGQYLLDDNVSRDVDACIRSSDKESRVTLDQIYRARAQSSTSLRNLPPLTSFFVMRQEPMNALIRQLVDNKTAEQHVMVLAGMGGSGKTQLALKFARDFEESFKLVIFIDASSADTLKKGLISRVRALGRGYSPETVEESLEILANPDDPVVRNWFIIYDNADDPDLDLQRYIPVCDTGAILITTRNTTLRHLSPEGYLELDVMSTEEAVTALLQAALPSTAKPTSRDREAAMSITQQLGYLPIAIIQAGCYIRQQQCLYEYSDMLKADRKATLERPAKNQRDMLKYGHSVYAALDITLKVLSIGSQHLLNILSSVHFTGFPRLVFLKAAKSDFSLEVIKLVDRSQEFQTTIDFLKGIFCPSGSWSESVLAGFLEELQQYSLVSLVSSTNLVTLRLHPLVHSWAQDRLSLDEQNAYRSAAVRLLACCAGPESYVLYDYLAPQIMSLSSVWKSLHANDRIALLQILDEDEDEEDASLVLERARDIYEEVKSTFGERDIRTSRAALFLAEAYGSTKNDDAKERIQREVISLRESLLGKEDSETIKAVVRLGKTLVKKKLYNDAERLLDEALRMRVEKHGESNLDTAEAMESLAEAYQGQDRHAEAQKLLETALKTRKQLGTEMDIYSIITRLNLSQSLESQGYHNEANALLEEALTLENAYLGTSHISTLLTMATAAITYIDQERFDDGERMLLQALEGFKESQWAQNPERLVVMEALALLYDEWGRPAEGIAIRKEELTLRREIQGDRAKETLDILQRQVSLYLKQGNFKDAIVEAKELAEAREAVLGDQHADTIVAYRLLASAFRGVGNYQEAEEVRRHEILLRRRLLGEEHPSVFSAIGDLARIVHAQKRHVEAETLWVESVEGMTRLLKETPNTELLNEVNDLVAHLDTEKRYEEAEDLAKGLVAGRTKVLGQDHMNTLDSLIWVGRIYTNRRKYAEAEQLWDDLLPRLKKTSGEDSVITINTLFWIGNTKSSQKKWADAEALWSEVHRRRKAKLGERHLDTISILIYLSNCAFRLGRLDEAASMRERNIELRREVLGPDHISVYEGMEQLAVVYSKLQQHDAAERLAREMMEKCEAKLGHLHPMTIRSRAVVAFTLQEQGRFSEAATLIEQVLKERIGLWGENHVMVARSKSRLARSYEALGRLTEAKELAEAALIVQRKELEPDNEALVETIELLKKLDTPPGTEIPQPTLIAGPPQSTEWPSGPELIVPTPLRRPVREETIDIDGYQSPALDPQANLAPPSISSRPASPFEQRNKFGRSPNPWSMFM